MSLLYLVKYLCSTNLHAAEDDGKGYGKKGYLA